LRSAIVSCAALTESFLRVGGELLDSAERLAVEPAWVRRTWPRRRYPQQSYAKTARYVPDHADIVDGRLVHGVASQLSHFTPLDHAWAELPGDIDFDGIVQMFFTDASYRAVMAAIALDVYAAAETRRLLDPHGQAGPWNAYWVPTAARLDAFAAAVRGAQESAASVAGHSLVERPLGGDRAWCRPTRLARAWRWWCEQPSIRVRHVRWIPRGQPFT
jgi:hypothetical protein